MGKVAEGEKVRSEKWLRGNAFGEVAQGERPSAEGNVAARKSNSAAIFLYTLACRPLEMEVLRPGSKVCAWCAGYAH